MNTKFIIAGLTIYAGFTSSASASIILTSPIEQSGTGLGAVTTLLTLQSPGNSTIETGCVAPSGSGTTMSGCGFADSNVQAQFGTPTLSAAGIGSAADLRIVFNASEPGNASANDIQLNQLVLTFYTAAGSAFDIHSLASPILFPAVENGTGNSGFVFRLDDTEATSAQSLIVANGGFGAVRVGLGASAGVAAGGSGSATGGLETFFLESAPSIVPVGGGGGGPVPEPVSMLLIGAGLAGIAFLHRRFTSA